MTTSPRAAALPGLLLFALALGGCHTVTFDPPAPASGLAAVRTVEPITFVIPPEVAAQEYSMRSAMTGIANKWTVPIGDVLGQYTASLLAPRFEGAQVSTADPGSGRVITLSIADYSIDSMSHAAYLAIRADSRSARGAETREFGASSEAYMKRTMMGGAMAAKSAIRGSTDDAMRAALQDVALWVASGG